MPRRQTLGHLEAILFDAPADAPTVVFFHGYGADAADLAPLAREIPAGRPLRWAFPDGPLALAFGGLVGGRAWFPIDAAEIQAAQMSGRPLDWSRREPEGLTAAREAATSFLEGLKTPWEDLVLGGFSQGAALAVDLALRAPKNPRGLVILSGTLIAEADWAKRAPARAGLPFFQSHGLADPILPHSGARKLSELLRGAGLKGRLLSFEGGHGIPGEVIESLGAFLDDPDASVKER